MLQDLDRAQISKNKKKNNHGSCSHEAYDVQVRQQPNNHGDTYVKVQL